MKRLTRRLGLKVISLVLAVLLYLVVQSQSPLMDRGVFTFRLLQRNVPAELVVTKMPEVVSVEAEGTREEIIKLKRMTSKLTAAIDLSEAVAGVGTYRVDLLDPSDVTVRWSRVEPVVVTLDTLKRVMRPVEVEAYNAPPSLEFISASVQPETVTLEGPESQIKSVERVRAQVNLGGSNYKGGGTFTVNVEVLGKSNVLPLVSVNPSQVIVKPVLSPALASKNVLVSPSWRGQPAAGFKISRVEIRPNSIDLRGDTRVLRDIQSIETAPIDLAGITSTRSFTASLVTPRGITANPKTVQVRVRIEAIPQPPAPVTTPPINP